MGNLPSSPALSSIPVSPTAPAASHTILFLCTGNYYRSRFAECLFNHRASALGLPWRASSAGLDVPRGSRYNVGPLSVHARRGLECRHILLCPQDAQRMPRQVTPADLAAAHLIIALKEVEHRPYMQRLHPDYADKITYWQVHDLDQAPPESALAEIERLVDILIRDLAHHP